MKFSLLYFVFFILIFSLSAEPVEYLEDKCISGNCENGEGVFEFKSGMKYEGQFKNKEMSGVGVMEFLSGNIYEGEFSENQFNGNGKFIFKDGTVYKGQFKDGLFDGRGVLYSNNGHRYSGTFKNHYFDGIGVYEFPDSSVFIGLFEEGVPSGIGIFKQGAERLVGNFHTQISEKGSNDTGKQKFTLNPALYSGYKLNVKNYQNYQECADGKTVTSRKNFEKNAMGGFRTSDPNDKLGYLFTKSGNEYLGEFKNGIPNGMGLMITNAGNFYLGEFKNGTFDGEGDLYKSDGQVFYTGSWRKGKRNSN